MVVLLWEEISKSKCQICQYFAYFYVVPKVVEEKDNVEVKGEEVGFEVVSPKIQEVEAPFPSLVPIVGDSNFVDDVEIHENKETRVPSHSTCWSEQVLSC